jgi:hypothetical protein
MDEVQADLSGLAINDTVERISKQVGIQVENAGLSHTPQTRKRSEDFLLHKPRVQPDSKSLFAGGEIGETAWDKRTRAFRLGWRKALGDAGMWAGG